MTLFWVILNSVTDYQKSMKAVDAGAKDSKIHWLQAKWLDSQFDSVMVAIGMNMNAEIQAVVASTSAYQAKIVERVVDASRDLCSRTEVQIVLRRNLEVLANPAWEDMAVVN
jgi:hypothetical protein